MKLYFLIPLFLGGCSYYTPKPISPAPVNRIVDNPCGNYSQIVNLPKTNDPSLNELVDLALSNQPKLRQAWSLAKQQSALLGEARGEYLPDLNIEVDYSKNQYVTIDAGTEANIYEKTYGVNIAVSWLLFDFGGRSAQVAQALHALCSAECSYGWEAQSVVYEVMQTYYQFLNAQEITAVSLHTVEDLEKVVKASTALVQTGVKSLSDKLQSQTELDDANVTLKEAQADLEKAKVNLTAALGIRQNITLNLGVLPRHVARGSTQLRAEDFLNQALKNRLDLLAARHKIMEQKAYLKQKKSDALPHFDFIGNTGKQWLNDLGPGKTFLFELKAEIPFFQGFKDYNRIQKAKALWEEAQSSLDIKALEVFSFIFSDYINLLKEDEIIDLSEKNLSYAQNSYDLIFAGYKSGINTIMDVLFAQNNLDQARKKLVNAQTRWFLSLSQLAYDSGSIKVD